jgi:hypothetical protein
MTIIRGLEGLDEIELGERAEALLHDPLMVYLFEELERTVVEEWKAARTPAERERAHSVVTALSRLDERMLAVAGAGEHARHIREAEEAFSDAATPRSPGRAHG